MLTRESQLSLGKAIETGYVEEKAKEPRQDASSVLPNGTRVSRQAGSGTKRHTRDALPQESVVPSGLSLTVPRGDSLPAKEGALSEKSEQGGNSFVFVLSKDKTLLARNDGYQYGLRAAFPPTDQSGGFHALEER
jgi:hypothetical protein